MFLLTVPRKAANDGRFLGNALSLDEARVNIRIQFASPEIPLTPHEVRMRDLGMEIRGIASSGEPD